MTPFYLHFRAHFNGMFIFCLFRTTDVHTIASLLKCYLRELPEPVIPFEQYEALLNAGKPPQTDDSSKSSSCEISANEQNEMRKLIKEQVNLLPQSNFDLLRYNKSNFQAYFHFSKNCLYYLNTYINTLCLRKLSRKQQCSSI